MLTIYVSHSYSLSTTIVNEVDTLLYIKNGGQILPKNDSVPNDYGNNTNKRKTDSLDNYNDNLSKQAVGSIMDKINNKTAPEPDSDFDLESTDNYEFDIDTNFRIKNNDQRKKLVSDFFSDDDKPKKQKQSRYGDPKAANVLNNTPSSQSSRFQSISQPRPQESPTYASKEDNVKYVTRGNHSALTPAMTAKRKNVTMMESQKIPIVTDEEIASYKANHAERAIAYSNEEKQTVPIKSSSLASRYNTLTIDQREIIEALKHEQEEKELQMENTLIRIDEENKRFRSILESTNEKLNRKTSFDEPNLHTEKPAPIQELNISEDDLDSDFYETISQGLDLDALDEQNIASNTTPVDEGKSAKAKPFIPTKNLNHTAKLKGKRHPLQTKVEESVAKEDYYDLEPENEPDNTQQNKYSTGEIRQINNTLATEITLEELDEFVFDNYDTADMEFLRKTIKEKSQARKMQEFDDKIDQFEKEHRDFSNKGNIPPKYQPKSKQPPRNMNTESRPVERNTENTQQSKVHPLDREYDSYDYRKSRRQTTNHSKYDTGAFDTSRFSTDRLNAVDTDEYDTQYDTKYDTRYNTASRRSANTSKIRTVAVDAEIAHVREELSGKILVSRIINFVFLIAFVVVAVYSFAKIADLNKSIETLTVTNADLVEQNNKITALQIDLDYYKDLYYNTKEGKIALENEATEAEANAEGYEPTDAESETDTNSTNTNNSNTSSGSTTTYTVVAGDTLSSISSKVYGTSTQYKKIMEANNLTSENLQLGQVLIIPQ